MPALEVFCVDFKPVPLLVAVTVAPPMLAPDESCTVPCIVARSRGLGKSAPRREQGQQ